MPPRGRGKGAEAAGAARVDAEESVEGEASEENGQGRLGPDNLKRVGEVEKRAAALAASIVAGRGGRMYQSQDRDASPSNRLSSNLLSFGREDSRGRSQ